MQASVPDSVEPLAARLNKLTFVLSTGANAGYSTALFKLLWPDATVVSMEPDSTNFQMLVRNTER